MRPSLNHSNHLLLKCIVCLEGMGIFHPVFLEDFMSSDNENKQHMHGKSCIRTYGIGNLVLYEPPLYLFLASDCVLSLSK